MRGLGISCCNDVNWIQYVRYWRAGPIRQYFTTRYIEVSELSTCMNIIWPVWIDNLATVASMASLALTIYVTFTISSIRRRYARKGRIPDILADLQTVTTELLDFLNTCSDEVQLDAQAACEAIQRLRPHVDQAVQHANGSTRKFGKGLLSELDKIINRVKKSKDLQTPDLWHCYRAARELHTYLSSLLKNDAWST